MSHIAHGRAPPSSRPFGLTFAHLLARILSFAFVALALGIPMLANAYPNAEISPVPISLGLLSASAFLATRPYPRRAVGAVVATLMMPIAAVVFMFGALAVSGVGTVEPDIGKMAAGLGLFVVAIGAASSAWGSPTERKIQLVAQSLAVVLLIVMAAVSVQTMAEPGPNYVEPVAMNLIGADLIVEVPYQGGCGTSHLTVVSKLRDKVLEVSVTEPAVRFRCFLTCPAGSPALCTDVVEQRLDRPPPYGTLVATAGPPPTRLRRLPFKLLLSGLLAGGILWSAAPTTKGRKATRVVVGG